MSTSPNDDGKAPTPPDKSTVILLLTTIGDTTWRMFIPIIGLAILGVVADLHLHTKPWLTVVGIIIGVAIASVLVLRQIRKG